MTINLQVIAAPSIFGAIIAVCILFYKRIGSRIKQYQVNYHGEQKLNVSYELTCEDAFMYDVDCCPICTLTWFKGDYREARHHLENRMRLLIEKNPWLLSFVVRDGPIWRFKHRLSYTVPDKYDDVANEYMITMDPEKSPINREGDIGQIGRTIHKSYPSLFIKNAPNEPIFRVVIIPCSENPNKMFGLLVQLSHAAGDGATYYELLHMLCGKDENTIIQLNPERNFKSEEIQIAAMGKNEKEHLSSFGYVMKGFFTTVLFMLTRQHFCFRFGWVDLSKIKEAKAIVMKSQKERDNKVQFVSTNDIITSWFMNQTTCPVGYMAINWRGRLEGHSRLNAGNYESLLMYQKEDFACPALIRQSLGRMKGKSDDNAVVYKRAMTRNIPGWFETATKKSSWVTNWLTFAKPNEIEGCEEDLHLPVSSFQSFLPYPLLIIFRGGPGRVGLCYYNSNGLNTLDECPFLKKQ